MRKRLASFAVTLIAFLSAHQVWAQDATVTASQGQSCAGTRFGSDLNCTSNDFTASLNFTQPALTAITQCTAGEFVTIDVIADIQSNSPNRFDVGIFIGENQNDPSLNNAANQCSHALAPTSPLPFQDADADICGDFQGGGIASLQVNSIRLLCQAAPGSNELEVPYIIAFSNNTDGNSCTALNHQPQTTSKCTAAAAGTSATVTDVSVMGYVDIIKQTTPDGDPQSFSFTTSTSPTATPSPASFSLTDGNTQRVLVPLSATGGTQQITITEALVTGWEATASIDCVTPLGGSAAGYVTMDNANRSITATLDGTNFGAVCTITNTKLPTVTINKISQGGTGSFSFSGTNGVTTQTIATTNEGVAEAGTTSILSARDTVTRVSETGLASGFHLTDISCTGLGAGGVATANLATGTVVLDAAATAAGADIVCNYTNGTASAAISKTVDQTSISGLTTLNYAITVENDGFAPLRSPVLGDNLVQGASVFSLTSGPALTSGDTNSNGVIDIGETWTYAATYAVGQANFDIGADIVNTATFQSDKTAQISDSATTSLILNPSLAVSKVADITVNVGAGQVVTYTITVINNGNQTISDIRLADTHGGFGTAPVVNADTAVLTDNGTIGDSGNPVTGDNLWDALAPGDELTVTASYTVVLADIENLQ